MRISRKIAGLSMLGVMALQMVSSFVGVAAVAGAVPVKLRLSSQFGKAAPNKFVQAKPVKLVLAIVTLILAIWAPVKLALMSEAAWAAPSRFDLFAQVGWESPIHFALAGRIASDVSFPRGVRSLCRRSQTMKRVTTGHLLVSLVCAGMLALITAASVLAYPIQAHASADPNKWIRDFQVGRNVDDTRVHEPSTTQEDRNERAYCDALVAARPTHPPC